MTEATVLVTGATGRIGVCVVNALMQYAHACELELPVRVLVRDAGRAAGLLPAGVETIVGDFDDLDRLGDAMQDTRAVLLVSPVHPDQCRWQGNVVRAALSSGCDPHIVKVSGLGTFDDSYVDSGRWHAQTEREIRHCGLPFTFLRPLFFMQNLGFLVAGARKHGVIASAVEDARIAMVDVRDIADVAVAALMGTPALRNQAVTLAESCTHSYAEVADLLAEVLGRNVDYRRQTRQQLLAALQARGEPAWHRRILDQFNRAFIEGWGDQPGDVVGDVLGRPARPLRAYLEEAAADAIAGAGSDAGRDPFPS